MSEPMTLQDLADQIEAGFRKVADAWNEAVKAIAESLDAECTEGAIGMLDTDPHGGCPCRKTGVHRVHRCEHGTEWWQNPPTVDASGPTGPGEGDGTGAGEREAQNGAESVATGGVYTGPPIEFEDPPGLFVPRVVASPAVPDGEGMTH